MVRAENVAAAAAVELYGLPRAVHPMDALLEELARTAGHVDWLRLRLGLAPGGADGLVGPVGTEGTDSESGLAHHPKYEPSVWLRLYQAERKHLADVASTCLKAGIDERKVQLAEAQGRQLAAVLEGVLNELGVDPEVARPVVGKHLRMVTVETSPLTGAGQLVKQ